MGEPRRRRGRLWHLAPARGRRPRGQLAPDRHGRRPQHGLHGAGRRRRVRRLHAGRVHPQRARPAQRRMGGARRSEPAEHLPDRRSRHGAERLGSHRGARGGQRDRPEFRDAVDLRGCLRGGSPCAMIPVVETRGLVKRYDGNVAVAGIDLAIGPGEIYGLVGPNGAGKTTTMKILATLLAQTAGEAYVTGIPVDSDPIEVRRRIGYMPDFYGVYDDLRVWEYLDFFARCYGVPANRRATMIGELLEIVGLTDKRDAYVETMSRGMRQRLCLAHTLVHDPALLILDEPASGLDPRARVEMREILRELRAMGKTILISSHILPELGEMCTGVAIIDQGRVLRSGSISEIERSLRATALLRIDVIGDPDAIQAASDWLGTDPRVGDVLPARSVDGSSRLEVSFDGTGEDQAALLRSMIEAGHRVVGFGQATSDLEEIFLKVTGQV